MDRPRLPEPTRSRDPAQIRAEIQETRDEVANALVGLRQELQDRLDWRWIVRRKPAQALGVAFAAGVWLGWR